MFSEKLKSLRIAKKMSQKDLAEQLNVAKSVVSFYENGDRSPSYQVLVKIAAIFNVTTDYLLDVERERMLNVSELSENDIAVVATVIEALKNKNQN